MPAESNGLSHEQQRQPQTMQPPPPPTLDCLSLPLPPVVLHVSIGNERSEKGCFQRYLRRGDIYDATAAVIGKGGFGTAYRYIRDDSYTPPSSTLDTTQSGDSRKIEISEDESIEALRRISCHEYSRSREELPSSFGEKSLKTVHEDSRYHQRNNYHSAASPPSQTRREIMPTKAPAVIVVKVCRTPTSGSYDELPKTGIGREEAKVAAHELAAGNPIGQHTRIVRGEARLLRYLQMALSLKRRKDQSYLVRLLADIPLPKANGSPGEDEEQGGPPVPRLLIFERLVELDAEISSRGWVKNKRLWTVEKVESVSRDVMAGLEFLHEHHIVHGDLKPSNFMRDPKTGCVKLIDLGASRRWVRLHNVAKERTSAVEDLDQAVKEGIASIPKAGDILCEGLGSLTGSPQ